MMALIKILAVAFLIGFGIFLIATMPTPISHPKSAAGLQGIGTGVFTCDEDGYRMATMRMLPGSPWFLNPGEAADAARSLAAQTKDECAKARFLDWATYFDDEEKKVQSASHADAIEKKLRQELLPIAPGQDYGISDCSNGGCITITTDPPTVEGFEAKP